MTVAAMTEAHLQASILDLARRTGWLAWHDNDSRRNRPGLPDLILVHRRTGRLLMWELKSDQGRVRVEQREWLDALGIRHEVAVIRPADWRAGVVQDVLTGEQRAVA